MIVDYVGMTLILSKGEVLRIQNQPKGFLEKEKVTVKELSKLMKRLSFTAITGVAVPLDF